MPVAPDIESGGYEVFPELSTRIPRVAAYTTRTEPVPKAPVAATTGNRVPEIRSGTRVTATSKETKTVRTVGLISLIGTGAGLLANGVKSLFDGTLKAKRQEKKAAKAAAKSAAAEQAKAELKSAAAQALGVQVPGSATPGSFVQTGYTSGMQMGNMGDWLQKNWMIVAVVALVLFGGKFLKPKRTYRRRRAAPTKTVYRYRTRKAPARRRRR